MDTKLFSFGVIADCQYDDAPNAAFMSGDGRHEHNAFYQSSPVKLREAITTFNAEEVKFVVHLGDFVDKTIDKADILLREVEALKSPFWHVLGNHDFSGSNGDVASVHAKLGLDNGFYSKIIEGYRFIILDTNELGVYVQKGGSPQRTIAEDRLATLKAKGNINALPWNGGVGDQQLMWLSEQLRDAAVNNQTCILFAHHPVFPPLSTNALNDTEILDVINRHNVVSAFINGHNHFGAVGVLNDIPFITVPAVVEGATNAYGIVDVYANTIKIRGYGRMQDMEFTI